MKKLIFVILGFSISMTVSADSNVMPKGMTGSMVDLGIPQNVEHVVPSGTAGLFFEASCFGTNNRGTDNPIAPHGKIDTKIDAGTYGSASVQFRGNFPGVSVQSQLPGMTVAHAFYQNSCSSYCDENPSHCNRSCDSFQSCFDSSGEAFKWAPMVTEDKFTNHMEDVSSFLNGSNTAVKTKWNDEIKARLSDQYDHIIRSNGSSIDKCGSAATERYVSKFDGLAQELCEVDLDTNKDTCRMKALCTFSCGIIRDSPLDITNTADANIIKAAMSPESLGYPGHCTTSTATECNAYNTKVNEILNNLATASSVGQCASLCEKKMVEGKGPGNEADYYKLAMETTSDDGCTIDGGSGTLTHCKKGLVVGETNGIKSDVKASAISVSSVQSETGKNSRVEFYGYNGVMKSNVYSWNVKPGVDGGLPFVRVTAEFPGQDGHCGGFHSPLMLFFGYKHPQYNNKSDFMKRHEDATVTYWPEKNHYGFFLAKLDKKNPKRGVFSAAQLFGDNTMNFNGFDFLREYDKNNDSKIDKNDEIWSRLVLWKDKNSDGHSSPDELLKLSDKGIFEISLDVDNTYSVKVSNRAAHKGKSSFKYRKDGKVAIGEVTDVFFADAN
jgi:hypothetical protein